MTNALNYNYNIENKKNLTFNPLENINFKSQNSKGSECSFSNLLNVTNANAQRVQSNFISKAAKSNTSSINKYALNSRKTQKSIKPQKQQKAYEKNSLREDNKSFTSEKAKQNSNLQSQKIEPQKTKEKENINFNNNQNNAIQKETKKANETALKNNTALQDSEVQKDNNSSDINNSSPVSPSPVFYDENGLEQNSSSSSSNLAQALSENNTQITSELKEDIEEVVQNFLSVLDTDLSLEDTKKIDEALSNINSIEDVEGVFQTIENIFQTSDYSQANKDDIKQALDKIKALIEQAQKELSESSDLTTSKAKELLDGIILKMKQNNSKELNSSNESGKITKEDIDALLEQTDITQADKEVLKDTVLDIQKLLNEAQKALDENDFEALKALSEKINSIDKKLEGFLNNKSQKPLEVLTFSKDLVEALKNLNNEISKNSADLANFSNINTLEVSKKLENLSELKLSNKDLNNLETDGDKLLKSEKLNNLEEILSLLSDNSTDEINSDEILTRNNDTLAESLNKTYQAQNEQKISDDKLTTQTQTQNTNNDKALNENKNETQNQSETKNEAKTQVQNEAQKEAQTAQLQDKNEIEQKSEQESKQNTEQKNELKSEQNTQQKSEEKTESKNERKIEQKSEQESEPKSEQKSNIEPLKDFKNIDNQAQNLTQNQKSEQNNTQADDTLEDTTIQNDNLNDEKLSLDSEDSEQDTNQNNDFSSEDIELSKTKSEENNQKQAFIKELNEDILLDIDYETNSQSALSVSDEVIRLSMSENSPLGNSEAPVGAINYDNNIVIKPMHNAINNSQILQNQRPQLSEDIFNQIGDKLTQLKDGSQKLTMVLRPNIIAQNEDVRAYIEKNINILRQQLTDSGINVNSIQIKTAASDGSGNFENSQNFNNQNGQEQQMQGENKQQNQQNYKQEQREKEQTLASMSNYDTHFKKDFSSIMNKTISYNLN